MRKTSPSSQSYARRQPHRRVEDIERIIQPGEHINVPHLRCLNSSVDGRNRALYDIAVDAGADHAITSVKHVAVQADVLGEGNLQKFLHSEKTNKASAVLEPSVRLVVGQEYEISVNLSVDDVIMKLAYVREGSRERKISDIIWIDFQDDRIGLKQKSNYRNYCR